MATPADPGRRHRLHRTLITVILLTVPFYVAGFAALQFLPDPGAGADASTPTVTTAPPKVSTLLPRTTPTDTPAPPTPEPLAMVNVAWGNLRSGPGTVYVVVAQLDEGTELAPLERDEFADWLRVGVKGTGEQGWISVTIVDINSATETLPVAEEIPPTPTATATATPSPSSTPTATASSTATATSTHTSTPTETATHTPTATTTATATATATPTDAPSPTATEPATPTPTATATSTATPTPSPTP